jgi:hypothetical protein
MDECAHVHRLQADSPSGLKTSICMFMRHVAFELRVQPVKLLPCLAFHQLVTHAQFCLHTGTVRQTLRFQQDLTHTRPRLATHASESTYPSTGFIIIMMLATARGIAGHSRVRHRDS